MEIRYNLPPAFVQHNKGQLESVVRELKSTGHTHARIPLRPRLPLPIGPAEVPESFKLTTVTLRSDLTRYRYIPATLVLSAADTESQEIIEAEERALEKEGQGFRDHYSAFYRIADKIPPRW